MFSLHLLDGDGLSAIWVSILGAVMDAAAGPNATPVRAFEAAGGSLVHGFGWLVVFGLLVGLLSVMAINQYGGMMSTISIRDSIKPVQPTRRIRAIGILVLSLLVWGIAQFVGIDRFSSFDGNVLAFLAYLFTPWTAINLVDYVFVRRGLYSIKEIFKPQGSYGRWGWRGQVSYLVALAVMVPFMVTTPFTGSIAAALGGVHYSIFIGLPVAGILYWVLTGNLDPEPERTLLAEEGLLTGVH